MPNGKCRADIEGRCSFECLNCKYEHKGTSFKSFFDTPLQVPKKFIYPNVNEIVWSNGK